MQGLKRFSRTSIVLTVLPLLVACSGGTEPTSGASEPGGSAAALAPSAPHLLSAATPLTGTPVTHKIIRPSGKTILLVTQGLPSADCALTDTDIATSSSTPFQLASDDLGRVRFFVDPGNTNGSPINMLLQCQTADGSTSTTPVELDVVGNPSLEDEVLTPHGTTRPALTGDPMSYTQEQLIAAGFPPRPDPSKSPNSYAKWLKMTSREATRVTGTPTPSHVHNSANSTVWSGCLAPTFSTYEVVNALWDVPAVTGVYNAGACPSQVPNLSSMWVGLGGNGTDGLIQDGTIQDVYSWRHTNCTEYYTYDYHAFVEYWSNEKDQQVYAFAVNPNDEVYAESWSAGSTGYPLTTTGAYGWYYIYDVTSGAYLSYDIQKWSSATFTASGAEWIIENPGNAAYDFADYNTANIQDGEVETATETNVPANDLSTVQLIMIAKANPQQQQWISYAGPVDGNDNIAFTWYGVGP